MKWARARTPLSQRELAQLSTGEDRKQTAWEWENDKATPRMDHAIKAAQALNVGVEWLLTGNEEAQPAADPLDEWGLARARAIVKLAELLEGDQKILELRAEAALNASIAARLEAEKAPNRSALVSAGEAQAVEEIVRRTLAGGLSAPSSGGTRRETPEGGQSAAPD